MKIVIDIPKGMLDELNTCKFPIQDAYRLCSIIENGQPLPKGHGRLIDADAVEEITWKEPVYTDIYNVLTDVREKVRQLPTIIEADKEAEDGKEIQ